MPNKTSIEWTDYSSNPIFAYDRQTNKRGWHCVHVSDGCRNCYAEAINRRFGTGLEYTKQNTEKIEFRLSEKECGALKKLTFKVPGVRVFIGDMLDIFQPAISDDLLNQLFSGCLELCDSRSILQILTKHTARMRRYLEWRWGEGRIPCRHIWLGTSVEDQKNADERIPHLLAAPTGGKRFISYEPALGPLDLLNADRDGLRGGLGGLHQIIIGGESGSNARLFYLQWARKVISDTRDSHIRVFVKQIGSHPISSQKEPRPWEPLFHGREPTGEYAIVLRNKKGGDMSEWPEDLRIREFPLNGNEAR